MSKNRSAQYLMNDDIDEQQNRGKELVDQADFLEKNWLKQAERHYDRIQLATRDLQDLLKLSQNPKCKACQNTIREAFNVMHNELESIRCVV